MCGYKIGEGMHLTMSEGLKTVYDKNGNLLFVTYSNGEVSNYEYDEMGNLVRISDSWGFETRYEYDSEGRLIYVSESDGEEKHMLEI